MLHSDKIPNINVEHDITDLFFYFGINWNTIAPAIYIILGTAFGYYVLKILKNIYID